MTRRTVSGWTPAEIAERQSDVSQDEDEGLRQRALDDLVERIMGGKKIGTYRPLYLQLILNDCDQSKLTDAILDQLSADPRRSLTSLIEDIVSDYVRDTSHHESRIDDMREEEREAAKERMRT